MSIGKYHTVRTVLYSTFVRWVDQNKLDLNWMEREAATAASTTFCFFLQEAHPGSHTLISTFTSLKFDY